MRSLNLLVFLIYFIRAWRAGHSLPQAAVDQMSDARLDATVTVVSTDIACLKK
jgi:hypothetical protein